MPGAGPISPQERFDRLRLARTPRIGSVTFANLLQRFGSASAALKALPELARKAGGQLVPASETAVEAELKAGQALEAQLCVWGEHDYPPALRTLDAPPPILWLRGDAGLLRKPAVAIVGARIASLAGQRFARSLATELGQAGWVVVSGLARGVDGAAHEGSLSTGTVAVLGGGIDDVFPPDHGPLYDQIRTHGLIVSESPVGHRAQGRDFPRRNRIISGLSRAVVVVEAELKSGSLITARLAAEQNREVFAVPGNPMDPRTRGTNDLLRQGAHVCESAADVLSVLQNSLWVEEPEQTYGDAPLIVPDEPTLKRLRQTIQSLLSDTPVPTDEMVRACNAPTGHVLAAMVELSLAGHLLFHPGGRVSAP